MPAFLFCAGEIKDVRPRAVHPCNAGCLVDTSLASLACSVLNSLLNCVKFHQRRTVDDCIQPPSGQPRLTRLLPGKFLFVGFPLLLETLSNTAQTMLCGAIDVCLR